MLRLVHILENYKGHTIVGFCRKRERVVIM